MGKKGYDAMSDDRMKMFEHPGILISCLQASVDILCTECPSLTNIIIII